MAESSNTDLELKEAFGPAGNGSLPVYGTTYTPGAAVPLLGIGTGAGALVTDGWQRSKDYADTAFAAAQNLLAQMATINIVPPSVDTNFTPIAFDLTAFQTLLGTKPTDPQNTFAFTEIPYSSNLLTDLRARLLEWVDGASTGLLPSVEQAIWDRGRAREVVTSNRKISEAVRSYAMRGFSKPQGALSLEIQDAVQTAQDASNTLSRDVMIKQADLEQSNRRFSFEQAEKIEEALIQYQNQQMLRAIESAKILQQFVIDIFHEDVVAYGVETQAYSARVGAEVAAFKAKSDVAIAEANLRLEQARVQLQTYVQAITLTVEKLKASAQISSQLCASALSSISLSGGIHDSASESISASASNSSSQSLGVSFGTNASYSYTP